MQNTQPQLTEAHIACLADLARYASYSLMDTLVCDPDATDNGIDHDARQVFNGHYVPVNPTPINLPEYISHSKKLFRELGFTDSFARSDEFIQLFSGDLSEVPESMRRTGWACGYAVSIFGTEYYQQCPFQTGNGYGDGRAISVLEAVINNQRWEMQLKGGGRTPYCRGADGRAVLRSSVREFLAQEHMHSLEVPTSRSLSLFVSKTDTVQRPWYSEGSQSHDPDMLVSEAVAISTRVAPSFIRVGQIELFGRRARKHEHPDAMKELEQIVLHAIDREYTKDIDTNLGTTEKIILLAGAYRDRLTSLVTNWIRVGYCQGNFNSDNCAVGGFTLDYGPFGFCEAFDPYFQPWTGGGQHFAFWNQPTAAQRNFDMFCTALKPLLASDQEALRQLDDIKLGFAEQMQDKMEKMWAAKLGLDKFDATLFRELLKLMMETKVDYTIFFRELSSIPDSIEVLKKSFYSDLNLNINSSDANWSEWLNKWKMLITNRQDINPVEKALTEVISDQMKSVNPKYILREWQLAPAYQQAAQGNYDLIRELQEVMTSPYSEQSKEIEEKYYRRRPQKLSSTGGISHMSCSS